MHVCPIQDARSLLDNVHMRSHQFFATAETRDGERLPCLRLPFTGVPETEAPNRPPRLCEHNDEVFGRILGFSSDEVAEPRGAGVIWTAAMLPARGRWHGIALSQHENA